MPVKSLNSPGSILRPKRLGRSSVEHAPLGVGMVGSAVQVCIESYKFIGDYDVDKTLDHSGQFCLRLRVVPLYGTVFSSAYGPRRQACHGVKTGRTCREKVDTQKRRLDHDMVRRRLTIPI